MAKLSKEAEELLQHARMCDGCEVPKPCWPLAEEIEKAGLGTLGPARGPDRAWRRLYPNEGDQT